MKPEDWKLSHRLAAGIAMATLLLVALIWIALWRLAEVKSQLDLITDDRLPKVIAVKDAKDHIRAIGQTVRNIVLLEDDAAIRAEADRLPVARAGYASLARQLRATTHSDKGQALLAKTEAAVAAIVAPTDEVVRLGLANRNAEATRLLLDVVQPTQAAALQALDEFARFEVDSAEELQARAKAAYVSAVALLVAAGAAAVALLVFSGGLLVRSVTRALAQAVEVARAVATGDLSVQFEDAGRSETAQLLQALKRMQGGLVAVVSGVRDNAQGVAMASGQIAQGNQDLSARTEAQASALEQTSAAMEELSGTVRRNADNAQHANELARSASRVAMQGGETMVRMVATMKEINDSSRRITDIIGLIDGIAFQTNILALNAAVESARAGEQGRGFAVVAAEVRALAQRSAEAAREIKSLILASVERIEQGTTLVDQAGTTIGALVGSIDRVAGMVGEISAASLEQAAGVAQIGETVAQMDRATQQNAALVEESAAAAESLKQQARQLVAAVSVFRLVARAGPETGRETDLAGAASASSAPVKACIPKTVTFPASAPPGPAAAARGWRPADVRHDEKWEPF